MRRSKKVLCCMIAALLCTGACGCGGGTSSSAETEQTGGTSGATDTGSEADTSSSVTESSPEETEPADDTPAVTPADVTIDGSVRVSPLNMSTTNGGSFEGWGTSLCWWANRVGYSDSLAQQSADAFFGEEGLHLNIMRYNIGGGDDPAHNHITRTDSEVPGWLVWDEAAQDYVYDYDADANQLNVLRRAAEAAGDDAYVEVFSNSPPYFMTESGCASGNSDASRDNIRANSYGAFADYLAHVAEYINNDLGIKVDSVSPMNEPDSSHWGAYSAKQEGCHVSAGENQSRLIIETARAFQEQGLSEVEIIGSDETDTGVQLESYRSLSDEARALVDRVSTHTYGTKSIAQMGAAARNEGFNLWMSEVDGSGTAGTDAGEMGSALWLAEKIISDINGLSPSAWVMWQVIDSHISAEGYNGNKDSGMPDISGGFWGTATADHDNDTIILTQKYYGFGQFTRYIRPGSTLIHCGDGALAAYDKESGELAIVAVNGSAEDMTYNFDLSQLERLGGSVSVIRTSGDSETGEHWAQLEDIRAYDGGFVAELKANSITTFVMSDVVLGEVTLTEISLDAAVITGPDSADGNANPVQNIIDGDESTYYDGEADSYFRLDLGAETEFDVIGFVPRAGYEDRMFSGKFYGSNDGESWELLYTVKGDPSAGMNLAVLPQTVKYRYVKFELPKSSKSRTFYCNLSELTLSKID